jgi:hypothetical protein
MAVDHRLDLLGMDLLAADIDDAAAPADKVIAAIAQFDDVAGIDKAVRVEKQRFAVAEIAAARCAPDLIRNDPSATRMSTSLRRPR